MAFLPITVEEVEERGWDEVDFVFVTGDSYRCIEQEQNLNSISAKNISSVNSDIPLEDIYEKALFLITQGQTNNEYKAGNESAIKEILSLISNV